MTRPLDNADRYELLSLHPWMGMPAPFNPRHGIRVTRAEVTTDYLICFECRQVQVWRGGKLDDLTTPFSLPPRRNRFSMTC